ncbi:uncharacterized protein BXZ73DRAFT_41250 [Epithele typhae]|uniref:uncharacterized protein n=1 Tax=Epithele typhae TaxID=378194 RepID=UPI002008A771|nr:uncharacterized protein BXZ73DRAFT_41250 [Epithele typhae]KAH9942176.1 hypothetical protein BXZ73DRAFT_41250 [Epithele typhae]
MRPTGSPVLFFALRQRPIVFGHARTLSSFALSTSTPPPTHASPSLQLFAAFARRRTFATVSPTTPPPSESADAHPSPASPSPFAPPNTEPEVYHGPLAGTFRRLKLFSLSSLTLTFIISPFFFLLETTAAIPLAGRAALAGIAVGTSGLSTAIVAWCGRPYVTVLRRLPAPSPDGAETVEMTTLTLGLRERVTTVYDAAFLVPTSRPFAAWELAAAFRLPAGETAAARAAGLLPREETVAETRTGAGDVLGSWVVSWDEHGEGTCREVGKVVR